MKHEDMTLVERKFHEFNSLAYLSSLPPPESNEPENLSEAIAFTDACPSGADSSFQYIADKNRHHFQGQ